MHLHLRKIWPALLFMLAATSAWAENHQVNVGGVTGSGAYQYPVLMFNPPVVNAHVGDTITFVNLGYAPHNVDADDGSFRCANGCDGAGGDGTPSEAGWTSVVTLTQAGTINYHCDVHGAMGMTGTINVAAVGGNVPITPAFTGAWYDPTQSGHGILIEIGANKQFLAWLFTFTPDGQQAWFGNVGGIDAAGTTATIAPLQTQGGHWPTIVPGDITQPSWGTLTFTFTDCDHGRVDFDSTIAGYGSGHMDLTRLTHIDGLTCP